MSVFPISLSRVPNLLTSTIAETSISSAQSQLAIVQNELSTGKQINTPSDNPGAATIIMQLQKTLARQTAYTTNINSGASNLAQTDSTLGDLSTLIQQAQQIASANVGSDVTPDQRQSAATVAQSLYNQAINIGNRVFNGMYLFGGDNAQQQPFAQNGQGIQYVGGSTTLQNQYDIGVQLNFQINGAAVFGSLTSQATGATNLTPALTGATQIRDLDGATGSGIHLGVVQISNGTVTKAVNLQNSASVNDIIQAINQAGVGSITASLGGQGIQLAGSGGENITVTDYNGGDTAATLGIVTPTGGAGVGAPVNGSALSPSITPLTPLAALRSGAGLDNSGLIITNGSLSKTVTWPSTGTVEDLTNAINGAKLGVKAQINATQTGIDIVNATQGTQLSIAENGGQSATELGLRTFSASTSLASLNGGKGVATAGGTTPDFQITRRDGSTFQVALGSAQTVQDVINAINTADGGNGVWASFASTGNGIALTDSTGGSGALSISALNSSVAAAQLGLNTASSGSQLIGSDVGALQSRGIFGNLTALINGLQTNNQAAITAAGTALQGDYNRVTRSRGQTGAMEQQLQSQQTQLASESTTAQSLLSNLQDTDMTKAITHFQLLQTTLQASLQTTAKSLNLTLLNFLA